MSRYYRNLVILAKVETTPGTYLAPAPATDALLISDASIRYDDRIVERDLLRPYFGASEQLIGDSPVNIEFTVEMAGSGTAGTAPAWGRLLRACAMAETVSAGAHVVYNPVSTGLESLSILYAADGVTHRLKGVRGTATLNIAPGSKPSISFSLSGVVHLDPAALAQPTGVSMTAWRAPLPVAAANTGDILIDCAYAAGAVTGGTALPSISAQVELGQAVEFVPMLGSSVVDITNRETRGNLKLLLSAATEATMFNDAKTVTTRALGIKHGAGAGQIVQLYAPAAQFGRPQYEESQGRLGVSVDVRFIPVSGNDELLIIVK